MKARSPQLTDRLTAPCGTRSTPRHIGRRGRYGAIGVLLLGSLLALPGIPAGAQAPPSTNLSRLANAPGTAAGQQVTVSGQVTASGQLLGNPAITLDDPNTSLREWVLVIGRARDTAPLSRVPLGTTIQVTGTIRFFNQAELRQIEQQTGTAINATLAELLVGRPILLARTFQPMSGVAGQPAGASAQVPRVTPRQVAQDVLQGSGQLAGRTVSLTGQVSDILSPRVMALENDVLVVSPRPLRELLPGSVATPQAGRTSTTPESTVQVIGEVRAFDPDALSRELGVDLQEPIFDAWSGRPVVIARARAAARRRIPTWWPGDYLRTDVAGCSRESHAAHDYSWAVSWPSRDHQRPGDRRDRSTHVYLGAIVARCRRHRWIRAAITPPRRYGPSAWHVAPIRPGTIGLLDRCPSPGALAVGRAAGACRSDGTGTTGTAGANHLRSRRGRLRGGTTTSPASYQPVSGVRRRHARGRGGAWRGLAAPGVPVRHRVPTYTQRLRTSAIP